MHADNRDTLTLDWNGYVARKTTSNGREVGVMAFMWTWAIIADITEMGYEDRWCYHNLVDALHAYDNWSGEGEPTGWHRHPNSGRRIDENGVEYVCR